MPGIAGPAMKGNRKTTVERIQVDGGRASNEKRHMV
jgi:hypothetical protein